VRVGVLERCDIPLVELVRSTTGGDRPEGESMAVVVSSFAGGDRLVCGYFGGSRDPSSSPRWRGVAAGESRS
jgi:hypothetical protein